MRPAATVDEFLAAPIGRYFAGRWFLIWVESPSLIGTVYFGRPDEQDFDALARLFALLEHPSLASRYDVLVDAAAVSPSIPIAAFEFLGRYLMVAREAAARMQRVAIVRPSGMFGATLAGVFHDVIRASFTAALFADRAEAAEWLAHPRAERACLQLDQLVDELRGTPMEVRRLREYLRARFLSPDLHLAAQALGLSVRSLQRALREAGTSFRAQVEHTRMRAAEHLLLDGDTKLEAVARAVGFSQLAHFVTAFRRVTGETPGQFRGRRRRADAVAVA